VCTVRSPACCSPALLARRWLTSDQMVGVARPARPLPALEMETELLVLWVHLCLGLQQPSDSLSCTAGSEYRTEHCNSTSTFLFDSSEVFNHRIAGQVHKNVIVSDEEIFISIKTAEKYHSSRLPPILLTWLQNVLPSQVSGI